MAQRRMFSLHIIDNDRFLDMPSSAQNLYFHLGMRADDDGFVISPRKTMKLLGCAEDDLKLLIAKNFVIPFDSGVCVITDWKENNYVRPDRYTPTNNKERVCIMTKSQLNNILRTVLANYNKKMDDYTERLWDTMFLNLDMKIFKEASVRAMKDYRYFPNTHEILIKYKEASAEFECEKIEVQRKEQERVVSHQAYCYLCGNSGFCEIPEISRCICTRGKDLFKFSLPQIKKDAPLEIKPWHTESIKSAIKRGENPFYWPDAIECLKDKFPVFDAEMKSKYMDRLEKSKNLNRDDRLNILKKMDMFSFSAPDGFESCFDGDTF